jgi:shikimate kinase
MIIGAKGCGKTEVSKYLAENMNNVFAIDYEKFAL